MATVIQGIEVDDPASAKAPKNEKQRIEVASPDPIQHSWSVPVITSWQGIAIETSGFDDGL